MYLVQKSINKLYSEGFTFFLNPREMAEVIKHLKKNSFLIYKPYLDSEKVILYQKDIPNIILFEIISPTTLRHQDILGALHSLGIEDNLFGDIIITNNHFYFYTFSYMQTFFEMEFKKIRNSNIELIQRNISLLENYQIPFEELQIITSSLRIDSVIAKIIHTNRENVKELIKDKKVILNYELLKDNSKTLNINDTFSIRKFGKYKFNRIISNTKKDNLIIEILKYTTD